MAEVELQDELQLFPTDGCNSAEQAQGLAGYGLAVTGWSQLSSCVPDNPSPQGHRHPPRMHSCLGVIKRGPQSTCDLWPKKSGWTRRCSCWNRCWSFAVSTLKERLLEGNREMEFMHQILIDLCTTGLVPVPREEQAINMQQ